MSSFREIIAKTIQDKRPKLSPSSLRTYVSTLVNLHKHLSPATEKKEENADWFQHHTKEILQYLQSSPSRSRKSVLSACFVLTEEPQYRDLMIEDCKKVNEDYKNQKMDNKEKDNWVEPSGIQAVYDKLQKQVVEMFAHKSLPHVSTMVEFFLLSFLGGVYGQEFPPRRSMDYALLKIRNYDPLKDNYYKSGKLFFNQYKTSAKYGVQTLTVPAELNKLIKKWIKLNKTDFMLVSSTLQPLSSPQISRILNKVFDGKHISTDMLRHIFLTNVYKDIPPLRKMEQLATDMGHSLNQQMLYVKRD